MYKRQDYNNNKIGVDLSDQRMSYGVFERRTVKWWRKLAFHILLMCIVNSSILYNKVKGLKIPVTQFMQNLSEDLVAVEDDPPMASTNGNSGNQLSRLATGKHFLEKIPPPPGKKRLQKCCKVCGDRGKKETGKFVRKDTSYQCCECKVALCINPCFKLFHSKKNYKV